MNEALRRPAIVLLAVTLALTGMLLLVLERPSEGQTRRSIACSTGLVGQFTHHADQSHWVVLYVTNTSATPVEARLKMMDAQGNQVFSTPRTIEPQDTASAATGGSGQVRLRGVVQILSGAEDFSHLIVTMDYTMFESPTHPLTDVTLEHCQPV